LDLWLYIVTSNKIPAITYLPMLTILSCILQAVTGGGGVVVQGALDVAVAVVLAAPAGVTDHLVVVAGVPLHLLIHKGHLGSHNLSHLLSIHSLGSLG